MLCIPLLPFVENGQLVFDTGTGKLCVIILVLVIFLRYLLFYFYDVIDQNLRRRLLKDCIF